MNEIDQALIEHMATIVFLKHRPFSFIDFLPDFEVNGREYSIVYGMLRNKFSRLRKKGEIEIAYRSKQSSYTIKGHRFGKQKLMTPDHTGVVANDFRKASRIQRA